MANIFIIIVTAGIICIEGTEKCPQYEVTPKFLILRLESEYTLRIRTSTIYHRNTPAL